MRRRQDMRIFEGNRNRGTVPLAQQKPPCGGNTEVFEEQGRALRNRLVASHVRCNGEASAITSSYPSSFLALLNFNTTMEGCRKKGVMYRKNGLCCPKLPNTGLEAPVYLLLVKKDLPNLAKQKSRAVQSAK